MKKKIDVFSYVPGKYFISMATIKSNAIEFELDENGIVWAKDDKKIISLDKKGKAKYKYYNNN